MSKYRARPSAGNAGSVHKTHHNMVSSTFTDNQIYFHSSTLLTFPALPIFHFIGKIKLSENCGFVVLIIIVIAVTQAEIHGFDWQNK